jgi:hypothetical protein
MCTLEIDTFTCGIRSDKYADIVFLRELSLYFAAAVTVHTAVYCNN